MSQSNKEESKLTKLFVNHAALKTVVAALLIQTVLLLVGGITYSFPDTKTYISAGETFLSGEIDIDRTPVYPLIIQACKALSGSAFMYMVVILQMLCFAGATLLFDSTLKRLKLTSTLRAAIVWFYGFLSGVWIYNFTILTESFSISAVILLIWLLVKLLTSPRLSVPTLVATSLLIPLMIFLRPSFTFLLVLAGILMIWLFLKRRIAFASALFCSILLSAVSLHLYCKAMERKTGVYTPTEVGIINDLMSAHYNPILTPDMIENPEIRAMAQCSLDRDEPFPAAEIYDSFTLHELDRELTHIKKTYPVKWYLLRLYYGYFRSAEWYVLAAYTESHKAQFIYNTLFYLPMSFVYNLLMLGLVLIVWLRRRVSALYLGMALLMWLFCTGQIGVNLLGSMLEWGRLFIPCFAPFLIYCALLFMMLKTKGKRGSKLTK